MKLWLFIAKRIVFAFIAIIGLTFIVFILLHTAGNNLLLSEYINPRLTGPAREQVIHELTLKFHLNDPIYVQYFYWLVAIFSGDLGYTNTPIYSGPVSGAIALFLPNTILLTIIASILIWIIGVPIGVRSAVKRDSAFDQSVRVVSFALYSMPIYLVAFLLILVFGVYLKILPFAFSLSPTLASNLSWYVNGVSYPTHIVIIDALIHGNLTAFANAILHAQMCIRDRDYVRLARAKGVPEKVVINLHARRNALIPVLTLYGYTVASLLGGAVVIEDIFSYPGMGYWTTQALLNNDVGGIMASTLIFGIVFVIASLLLDIIYALIDPRIRY
ncbi:ABC transporter permease [Sulfolobus acidocaldarius]|uniref:ABC transporter permease n=1 Tax=Sulfolobus acidocaldarius TaxID=2285 RepID=UPI000785CE07|nr:ABC transporter permease [Sulfolobus acidocaldarius]